MKGGIWLLIALGVVTVIMVLPGMSVADPCGAFGGPNGIDPWFQGDWSADFAHDNDDQSGVWLTGVYLHTLGYKDANMSSPEDDYNLYACDIMIPWIRINWLNIGDRYYPHDRPAGDGGTNHNRMMLTWWQFSENNTQSNQTQPTIFDATYELDVSINGFLGVDFTIYEEIVLSGGWCQNNANTLEMRIGIVPNPQYINQNWQILDNSNPPQIIGGVTKVSFAYHLQADVDTTADNIYEWNGNDWDQLEYEDGPVSVGQGGAPCAKADSDMYDHDIAMLPIADGHSTADYWCLVAWQYEITKDPTVYVTSEGVVENDVCFWYVESFATPNNPPPTGFGGGWAAVQFCDFEA